MSGGLTDPPEVPKDLTQGLEDQPANPDEGIGPLTWSKALASFNVRGIAAVCLGVAGALAVGWVVCTSAERVKGVLEMGQKVKDGAEPASLGVVVAGLVAHASVSIALIGLAYGCLRAVERFMIPPHLLSGAKTDADLIRALLGHRDPLKTTLATVKELAAFVKDAAGK